VHGITGKGVLREVKVRKPGSGKRKVEMETLKYAVVRGPKVRSVSDVRTLTKLTPQCRFSALQRAVITYLTDFKCRRTGRNRTKAQWKREGTGMFACSEEVSCAPPRTHLTRARVVFVS